jgi:hypothetical protein
LSGPVTGYTFDAPTASVRAVMGFPGAASFGPALLAGLDAGWIAPGENFGLVFQAGNPLLISELDSAQISETPVAGLAGQPEGVTWSGDGSTAVLYSLSGNWIQTLSSLPNNPTVGALTDVSTLGGSLSAVAVDQSGVQIAVAITGGSAGVFSFSASQGFAPLLQLSNPAALAFSADGSSLLALDTSSMQLSILDLASFNSQSMPLGGLADPFAVRAAVDSQNRQIVYVASKSDQLLREYTISDQQPVTDLPLYFPPGVLSDFGKNTFVIAGRSQPSDPLWLLANLPEPAVYFVPAIPVSAGGQP